MKFQLLFFVFVITHIFSCETNVTPEPEPTFDSGVDLGVIENTQLDEASGIVAGRVNANMFWAHNDSGDTNRIFLLDQNGKGLRQYFLKGATNRDWEDIAITGDANNATIYVGDIGDNIAEHEAYYIYRFQEPKASNSSDVSNVIENVEKISFKYPDGKYDAECLMVDHQTKDLYICTKRENNKRLYRLSYPQSTTSIMTAEFVGSFTFSTPLASTDEFKTAAFVTAGDISQDNRNIIIRNYYQVLYWRRATDESITTTLNRPAKILPYIQEPQGEGLCFTLDISAYYTIGEQSERKLPVHMFQYKKK